ncbi:MAG: hypothetical protein ABFD91_02915 [Anaerohalosphaeraceae bacterium]
MFLKWHLKNGKHLDFLIRKKKVPADFPALYEDIEEVWRAFRELNECRTSGFNPNPIPLSEIKVWCDINEIRDVHYYHDLIKALDKVYLDAYIETRN